jgi:hypothetical protein
MSDTTKSETPVQKLHLVFGGELEGLDRIVFTDMKKLDLVGVYGDFEDAHAAWRSAAQRTVDDAHMRYFIVPLHELLDPSARGPKG